MKMQEALDRFYVKARLRRIANSTEVIDAELKTNDEASNLEISTEKEEDNLRVSETALSSVLS